MSNQYLPPELLDTITDFLHESRDALKKCCLVSKSWVPRTRKFLFANIEFRTAGDVESWKSTFPDPFTSPARYTKTLSIKSPWAAGVASVEEGRWIRSFSQVVHLKMNFRGVAADESTYSLFPFHGFSPAIKSLRLVYTASPLPLILQNIRQQADLSVSLLHLIRTSLRPPRSSGQDVISSQTIGLGSTMATRWSPKSTIRKYDDDLATTMI